MPIITYQEADGSSKQVELQEGWSLLQGAFAASVSGIIGECGGAATCGTCHCYIDPARQGDLPAPEANELEMLEFVVAERRPTSRLACQIKATAAIDGLIVVLPEVQQ